MAKEKEPTTLAELKAQLEGVGIADKYREQIIKDWQKEHGENALKALSDAVTKVLGDGKLADARGAIAGSRVRFMVTLAEDGTPTVEASIARSRSSSKGAGRGKGGTTVLVNGTKYESAAEACRALGIAYEGRSAVAVLRSQAKKEGSPVDSFEIVEEG